jgi:hypothetical protein
LGIGLAIVSCIIAYLIYSSQDSDTRVPKPNLIGATSAADPYAANMPITGVNLSEAENGMGGVHIYIEGVIGNTGQQTVTGATVEITFRNSLGQIVQRETQPLMIILAREPADDVAAMNVAPLKPGASREFRLTFEHVSADWNREHPELKITTVLK